jgi:glutamine---fructose-6-phosphate transaminase (isomerizing)
METLGEHSDRADAPSILLAEIREQPEVIRRLLTAETGQAARIARTLRARRPRYAVIAARGTSDNAARYGQYILGALNRLTVALATPSLYTVYRQPPSLSGALVIGVSQSGQSPDVVSVVEEGRRQGAATVAITNEPASPLALAAQHVLELHAGQERSVAATKTYTAQLAALALLSVSMADSDEGLRQLEAAPRAMTQALAAGEAAQVAAASMAGGDRCAIVGRGFNYATACEIALKMKELAYVTAEPYSSADFMHGPIAMVEGGFPVVLVDVGTSMRAEMSALRGDLGAQGARRVTLTDDPGPRDPGEAWIPVPTGLAEWLTPLAAIVPGQLLAYYLTLVRGADPDRPRAIGKVTKTI